MQIDIYTDGSGQTSTTNGGYGWVMVVDGQKHSEGSGHVENVSNNDMELEAAIQGLGAVLKYVKENGFDLIASVTLVSDSQIVLGWASGVYKFKQISKVAKYDQLRFVMKRLGAKTRWVRGHSGDEHNERCDKLANYARKNKEVDKDSPKSDTQIGTKKNGVVAFWYGPTLKIVDFDKNIVEDYNREVHGKRGGVLGIREEKSR